MNPLLVSFVAFLLLSGVARGAVLENPAPNSIQSGISVVSLCTLSTSFTGTRIMINSFFVADNVIQVARNN